MAEIVQRTTEHLREAIERLGRETQARFDQQSLEIAE
jgi:hypothetical protein